MGVPASSHPPLEREHPPLGQQRREQRVSLGSEPLDVGAVVVHALHSQVAELRVVPKAEGSSLLHAQVDQVKALGLDDAFLRMWDFYLCYCEGGFAERTIGDAQLIMERPGAKTDPLLARL